MSVPFQPSSNITYMSVPQYVNYGLPTLMLMAGLDGLPGGLAGSLTPACVPEVSLTWQRRYQP